VQSCRTFVVESADRGGHLMRKAPEPRIYQFAAAPGHRAHPGGSFWRHGGETGKGARALGMHTIKVDHTTSAIDELEEALGIPLPRL